MKLRYTKRARLDLTEIHDHIARHNLQAARRVVTMIRRAVETLPPNPAIGRSGRVDGTRELVVGRYPFVVAYAISEDEIQVLAIVHTSRLWPEAF